MMSPRYSSLQRCLHAAVLPLLTKDSSHDHTHLRRVAQNAINIARLEGGRGVVLLCAAYTHDLVKTRTSQKSVAASARMARQILRKLDGYDIDIKAVSTCILEHSWSMNVKPSTPESAVFQDADRLESTGMISLARTFSSAGQMGHTLFHPEDPFCRERHPSPQVYAFDLFYSRLLLVADRMNTMAGRKMAAKRHDSLLLFARRLKDEL